MVVGRRLTEALWYGLCLTSCVDTGLFVYLSLSQTLLGGLFILLLGLSVFLQSVRSGTLFPTDGIQRLVLAWLCYLALHATLKSPETYKLAYLAEMLLLPLFLPVLINGGCISRKTLENGILLIACIQVTSLTLQSTGLMQPYSGQFRLTGMSENPNVTAILLAVCLPLAADRIRQSLSRSGRTFLSVLALLMAVFVIVLGCRTAWLGLATVIAVRTLLSKRFRRYRKESSRTCRLLTAVAVLVAVTAAGVGLYRYKQASADGRILVWKVSAGMLKEHPEGIGIGMFGHDYNLRQGEYFAGGKGTDSERMHADSVYMAYNDFLEHGVEGGWPAALLLAAFYVSLMARACRHGKVRELSFIAAFFVMSFTNFICATVQPVLLLMICGGSVLSDEDGNTGKGGREEKKEREGYEAHSSLLYGKSGRFLTLPLWSMLWTGWVMLATIHVRQLCSQVQLGYFQKQVAVGKEVSIAEVEELADRIGTSEAYWRFLSGLYIKEDNPEEALRCISKAAEYTSEPEVFLAMSACFDRLGQPEKGITCLNRIREMLPRNLTSRYILLRRYEQTGRNREAQEAAKEIVSIPVRKGDRQGAAIKEQAIQYISNQNKGKQKDSL